MPGAIKSDHEQKLAMSLFAQRIRLLDEHYREYLQFHASNGHPVVSFNDFLRVVIASDTENQSFTKMEFYGSTELPPAIKNEIVKEFNFIFRDC